MTQTIILSNLECFEICGIVPCRVTFSNWSFSIRIVWVLNIWLNNLGQHAWPLELWWESWSHFQVIACYVFLFGDHVSLVYSFLSQNSNVEDTDWCIIRHLLTLNPVKTLLYWFKFCTIPDFPISLSSPTLKEASKYGQPTCLSEPHFPPNLNKMLCNDL